MHRSGPDAFHRQLLNGEGPVLGKKSGKRNQWKFTLLLRSKVKTVFFSPVVLNNTPPCQRVLKLPFKLFSVSISHLKYDPGSGQSSMEMLKLTGNVLNDIKDMNILCSHLTYKVWKCFLKTSNPTTMWSVIRDVSVKVSLSSGKDKNPFCNPYCLVRHVSLQTEQSMWQIPMC